MIRSVLDFRVVLVFLLLLLALVALSMALTGVFDHLLPVQPSHGPLADYGW
jgi:hypothetical protein